MINSNKGVLKIEGTIHEILADFALLKLEVIKMIEQEGLNVEEAFSAIEESIRFSNLRKSGMSLEEAMSIIAPNASKEALQVMKQREEKFQNEQNN